MLYLCNGVLTGYRTKRVPYALIPVASPGTARMQVVPSDRGAPSGDGAFAFLCALRIPVKGGYALVGGHLAQDVGCGKRALGMQVAPPRYRLDAPLQAHAPMAPEHLAQLGIHAAFYPVVRGGNGSAFQQLRIEVGEQRAGAREPL